MTLKELNIKLTVDITGNEERAIDNLLTDMKNHFRGRCWGEQYCSEERKDRNYAYRVNEFELRKMKVF